MADGIEGMGETEIKNTAGGENIRRMAAGEGIGSTREVNPCCASSREVGVSRPIVSAVILLLLCSCAGSRFDGQHTFYRATQSAVGSTDQGLFVEINLAPLFWGLLERDEFTGLHLNPLALVGIGYYFIKQVGSDNVVAVDFSPSFFNVQSRIAYTHGLINNNTDRLASSLAFNPYIGIWGPPIQLSASMIAAHRMSDPSRYIYESMTLTHQFQPYVGTRKMLGFTIGAQEKKNVSNRYIEYGFMRSLTENEYDRQEIMPRRSIRNNIGTRFEN
ncbi:MAG: hypothetical protein HY548_05265 [Elusimicrobia bacterium]|nr:hypothetical protein [Elusimicrobiota bacterium]